MSNFSPSNQKEIQLIGENVRSQTLYFEIAWSGKWQDNLSEMLREIVVTQIGQIKTRTTK